MEITSDESVCTRRISDRWCSRRRCDAKIRVRDVPSSPCGYRKSIRVNLRGLGGESLSSLTHRKNENAKRKSVTKTCDAIRPAYVRCVPFVERLCKYFRRRNGIIRKRNRFTYGRIDSTAGLVTLQRDLLIIDVTA